MTIRTFIEKGRKSYPRFPQEWKDGETILKSKGSLYFPKVSPKDVELVAKYRWYYKDGYAITSIAGKRVKMHHLIFGKPKQGLVTDHVNRDRMDNRRENVRFITGQQNHFNMGATGIRKRGKKWTAQIQVDRKVVHLGTFEEEGHARGVYLAAKKELHVV